MIDTIGNIMGPQSMKRSSSSGPEEEKIIAVEGYGKQITDTLLSLKSTRPLN